MTGLTDLLPRDSVLTRVGERSKGDKKYESDEFALINSGVVAPRPKGVSPTAENAAAAVVMQNTGGVPSTATGFRERATAIREALGLGGKKKLKKAQAGITDPQVFAGSDLLAGLMAALGAQAQTYAVDVPAVQQSLFGQLGYVDPTLLGITDPQEFRIRMALGQMTPEQIAAMTAITRGRGPGRTPWEVAGRSPTTRGQAEDYISGLDLKTPTLGAKQFDLQRQQVRTQRELRGLQPVAGANAIPSFG